MSSSVMETRVSTRISSIELGRIICMLLIVSQHMASVAIDLNVMSPAQAKTVFMLIPFGKIGFNCFLAMSMWFLVESSFHARRFISTWFEVLFYTAVMGGVALALGFSMTKGQIVGLFLPIGGQSHGFAATYLAFYALLPIWQRAFNGLNRTKLLVCILIILYVQVLSPILGSFGITDPALHFFQSEIFLFILVYCLTLYIKRYCKGVLRNKLLLLIVLVGCWLYAYITQHHLYSNPGDTQAIRLALLASNENSILFIVSGFAAFFLFKEVHIPQSNIINAIASTTLGVLLIHTATPFSSYLWAHLIKVADLVHGGNALINLLIASVVVFSCSALIDAGRKTLVERPLLGSKGLQKALACIDMAWK